MSLEEYEKIKNLNYDQYCKYLQNKYGSTDQNYFTKNFNRNPKISRTKEGLYAHHIYENQYPNLSEANIAKRYPYECQLGKNIIYCDMLEHLFLHILIVEESNEESLLSINGITMIADKLKNIYKNIVKPLNWEIKCIEKINNDSDVFETLKNRISKKNGMFAWTNQDYYIISRYAKIGLYSMDWIRRQSMHYIQEYIKDKSKSVIYSEIKRLRRLISWSEEDISEKSDIIYDILKKYYKEKGAKYCSQYLPNLSTDDIDILAIMFSLRNDEFWYEKDDDILKTLYPEFDTSECASILRKSEQAVEQRADILHIIKGKIYTEEEDKIIMQYYPINGNVSCNEVLPNRSLQSLENRARFLRLQYKVGWTKEEDNIIKLYYADYGPKKCKEYLKDKTIQAITHQAKKLKIKYNKKAI